MPASVVGGSKNSISKDIRKGFKVEGLSGILKNLDGMVNATTGREIKETYLEAGTILRDQIKANAPVRTGLLRRSVFVGRGDPGASNVLVGVSHGKAPHAHLVEYGTVKRSAHPFVRPALAQSAPAVAATIKAGLEKIIKAHTK